ncbi:MAG: ParB/RepB/Spo0J family partition protein [Saprospiraceae bacterium]|nr:ParB/RepB/Spo0J family partition protein [Saprospiraceae bacterium]
MTKKEELHKGLKSLLKDIEKKSSVEKTDVVKKLSHTVAMLSIDKIEFNPFQPRNYFDEVELNELAESIRTLGLIQPVTVRSVGGEFYQLISGERRLRASKMAGLKEIPAYIRIADDQAMIEMALVENIQRTDLNSLEIAFAYQRLIDECILTHDKVAERVGKNRSTVTNYLRLLKLPPTIQNGIKKDIITMGHARALAGVEDPFVQLKLYNEVVSQELSVRSLESRILSLNTKKETKIPANKDPNVLAVQKKMEEFFGSKIEIQRNEQGKGHFVVKFNSDENFNDILEKLGII